MLRLVGLEQRAPGPFAATGTTDGLAEQLPGALRGALIGQVERDVRGDDADERHLRHVEPLGDEARADEDVAAALREVVDDAGRRALALDDVTVEARDAQLREADAQLLLDALGAATEVADARRPAGRAATGHRSRRAAVMAAQRHRPRRGRRAAAGTRDRPGRSRSRDRAPPTAVPRRLMSRIGLLPSRPVERLQGAAKGADRRPRLPSASSARRSTTSTVARLPERRS